MLHIQRRLLYPDFMFWKILATIIGASLIVFPEPAATVAGIVMLLYIWGKRKA